MEPDEYSRMAVLEASMWWYRALHARLLDAVADHSVSRDGPMNDGAILDAGCGTGGLLARLDPARAAVGLEWHEPAAAIARAKSGRPVARGSINAMPFADASFAIAIAADVLCHAAVEPVQALAEIHRVLRPGGRLIVNMPAFRALLSEHDARVHNARRMNARQTRAMLEAAGLRVLRLRYWNSLLLPLMVLRRKVPVLSSALLSSPLLSSGLLSSEGSDVAAFPPWLDRMLHGMTELERRLPFSFPAGGSVLAIAERP